MTEHLKSKRNQFLRRNLQISLLTDVLEHRPCTDVRGSERQKRKSYTYQVCPGIIGWDSNTSGPQHTPASMLTLDLTSRIQAEQQRR